MNVQPWMVLFLLLAFARTSFATSGYANWGSGAYSAMPRCGYELRAGREAIRLQDELDARRRELRDKKSQYSRLRSRRNSLFEREDAAKQGFRESLRMSGDEFNSLEQHVNSGANCSQYQGFCGGGYSQNETESLGNYAFWDFIPDDEVLPAPTVAVKPPRAATHRKPAADLGGARPDEIEEEAPPADDRTYTPPPRPGPPPPRRTGCRRGGIPVHNPVRFHIACDDGGRISRRICGNRGRGRPTNQDRCEKYLDRWMEAAEERRRIEDELEDLKAQLRDLEAEAKLSRSEAEDARRQAEEDMRRVQSEGGCTECLVAIGPPPNKSNLILDIAGIAVQGLLGYQSMKSQQAIAQYQIDTDAKIGFRSNGAMPMSNGFGYAFLANGVMGALASGLGQGAYGCSGGPFGSGFPMGPQGLAGPYGGMNFNGAFGGNPMQSALFGFPPGYYGTPMGNGMFNPGVGAGFQIGLGSQAYCPRWPCPPGYGAGGFGGGFGGMPYGPGGFGGGGSYPTPLPQGMVPYGGFQSGAFPAGYGPGGIGINGSFNGGFPGGVPGGYPGGAFGGGAFGAPGVGGGMNFQAQAAYAQQAAQQAAWQAQQAQQSYYQQQQWMNNYMQQQQVYANQMGQMAALSGQIAQTQAQMGYLGGQYSLYGGAGGGFGGGAYSGYGGWSNYQPVPGFAPNYPPPPQMPPPSPLPAGGSPYINTTR